MSLRDARYPPIEDHGVVGDLHTVALVAMDGTIDFLCFPHFDSPTVFASLLDRDRGGEFRLEPVAGVERRTQLYLPDSNVLLTRFQSLEGLAELSDLMPVEEQGLAHNLVRRIKCIRGSLRIRMSCRPRFDYARAEHRVEHEDGAVVFTSLGEDALRIRLWSNVPLEVDGGDAIAEFTLAEGEHASFVLDLFDGEQLRQPSDELVSTLFKQTLDYWRKWVATSHYRGRWREAVDRSALVLKMLVSARHGSIVAAPTFGLPESRQGVRNWDYRYAWVRDSSFTLYALLRLGFKHEAARFNEWIEDRCQENGGLLQVLYALDGGRDLHEVELSHLEGYRGSRPVRIGNAAYDQLQLDIYGELMDSVYLYDKYGEQMHYELWGKLTHLVDWVCENWERPDEGIWEVRSGRKHFLYSRIMCWVAVDRALRLANRRSLPADIERWRGVRDAIYRQVHEQFWDPEQQAFVQALGEKTLDASVLIMPLVRMIGPTDERWLSTLRAVERELISDSLVYRYRVSDGLAGTEGTFSMCTFWYVECLSRSGDVLKARFVFEKMLGHANHLGLFGEQLGPCDEHRGNFPQALTHLALISAAFDLDRRLGTGR